MKSKVFQWSAISVLIIALGAGLFYWLWQPQTLVLSDGTKLSLLKVTYGKHHAYARKDKYGRPVRSGTISTTNDTLCLWIQQKHKPNSWPQFQMMAYDRANTACAGSSRTTYGGGPGQSGSEVVGILFDAFPRRGWLINFRAQEWNQRNGRQQINQGQFVIRNPAHGGFFAKWTPESLPIKKEDDDVAVTLTRLTYDANTFHNGMTQLKPNDPQNKAILAAFQVEQNGKPTTNWHPVQIETSDATGNHAMNRSWSNHNEEDQQIMTYQWGLWPDEPAWKLRVELSRQSDFSREETWTVTGVLLTPGKMNDLFQNNNKTTPAAETTIGETHLELYPPIQLAADQARMYGGSMEGIFRIRATPPPDGMRLTLIKVTDDQDRPVNFNNWGSGGSEYRFALKKLGDAKTLNLTLALHRSRYVEFTAKPQP